MADSYEAPETDEQVIAENKKTFEECAALVTPLYSEMRKLTNKPMMGAAGMLLSAAFIMKTHMKLTPEQTRTLVKSFLLDPLTMAMPPEIDEAIRKATETSPK